MLDRLKFVYGAMQDRAILPALSHFFIYDGRVQGTDGRMAIDAPLPEYPQGSITVPGDRFLKAIEAAGPDARIEAKDKHITVRGGRFRARIPVLIDGTFPRSEPDPDAWSIDAPLLPTLKRLRPFVATDAMKPWATSILLTATGATATNNVCLVSEPCSMLDGTGIDAVAIPGFAVDEILRLGLEPTGFGVTDQSITFYFDGLWIKTQLINVPWPVERVIELLNTLPTAIQKTPESLSASVAMVVPFCLQPKFPVVIFSATGVATEDGEHCAAVDGYEFMDARFDARMLQLVLERADCFEVTGEDRAVFRVGATVGIIKGLRA